jgi:hypothetical protein
MRMRNLVIYGAALAIAVFVVYRTAHHDYYSAITVTGATPLAVAEKVPSGVSLEVTGRVKQDYRFTTSSLRAFATTRIRTIEISPEGEFLGSYIHVGIPVFNILEGVAPSFPEGSPRNFPTDFLVTFVSETGDRAVFSYGELLMVDDCLPVTLAFHAKELSPTSDPETYAFNRRKGPIEGLRLISPRDPDTSRYLDKVTSIVFSVPGIEEGLLPERRKDLDCRPEFITVMDRGQTCPANFVGVERSPEGKWVKVGHGQGFKGISTVMGFSLRSFLEKNVPDISPGDFFLFASCDGYRCLFSAREIFFTQQGASMVLIDSLDGSPAPSGMMLGCLGDYFIDRSIWGISHLLVLRQEEAQ